MDNDIKMLFQVQQGDIIHIVGRLLRPFCSHALYRVRVIDLHDVGHGCFVIQGSLIDFNDSPVTSYALPRLQHFRFEELREDKPKLKRRYRAHCEGSRSRSVGFREIKGSICVYSWKYLCTSVTKQGKPTSKSEKYYLGKLSVVALMGDEGLASLVRAKFGIIGQEETEKVEATV